jgi:hypothetical protein
VKKRAPTRTQQLALFDQQKASISDKLMTLTAYYRQRLAEGDHPLDIGDEMHSAVVDIVLEANNGNEFDALAQLASDLVMVAIRTAEQLDRELGTP